MVEVVRVFTNKAILIVDEDYHEVVTFHEGKKLKKGVGYVKGDHVYVYHGKLEKFNKNELTGGIYQDRLGDYIFIEHDEAVKDQYHLGNVTEMNLDRVFNDMGNKEGDFIDPEDIEIINNNIEVWQPTIKEDDDFLKYIVKKIIIDKQVNLKNYRSKFANQFSLNNMKSGLNKNTKMTVPNFKVWCEILGIKWTMVLENNDTDKITPLPEPIEVTSDDFL
jgi:hypothetical protein